MSWLDKKETLENRRTAYAKVEQGDNVFRLFEFSHTVNEADFVLERYDRTTTKVGQVEVEGFAVTRKHFKPSFTMCGKIRSMVSGALLGDCEHCEKANEILDDDHASEQDKMAAKRWLANDQYVFVCVNVNEQPMTYRTLELSRVQGLMVLEMEQFAQKKGRTVFGVKGKDILIRYDKNQKDPKQRYKIMEVDSSESTDFKGVVVTGQIPDLFADPNLVDGAWRNAIREHAAPAQKSEAQAPAAEPAPKATAPKATIKGKKAKAETPWPPVVGQKVNVLFDGDEKQEGTVQVAEGEAGSGMYEVQIGDENFACTLEEMEKIG